MGRPTNRGEDTSVKPDLSRAKGRMHPFVFACAAGSCIGGCSDASGKKTNVHLSRTMLEEQTVVMDTVLTQHLQLEKHTAWRVGNRNRIPEND